MNIKINGVEAPEINQLLGRRKAAAQAGKEEKIKKLKYPLPVGFTQLLRFYFTRLRG